MRFRNSLLIPVVGVAVLLGGVAARSGMGAPLVPVAAAQSVTPGTATNPFAGIVVSGSGTVTAAPDVAYVSAGVTTQAATARQASDANSTTMTAVIAAIKAAGVADKDVQTTNFSISPVYSQVRSDTGSSTITGYRVDNSVRVTVNVVGDAAKVLDAVV
ncbi:MAG TPA: SIMPL domain-containing protein, partial [Chloroflexota bacterium]